MIEAGFICPQLSFALRNPQKIADRAQKVIKDATKNVRGSVLRCPIQTSMTPDNMPEGQLIEIEKIHLCSKDALTGSQQEIPFGRYALFFIDDKTIIQDGHDSINKAFERRPTKPIIFSGTEETSELKNWLCDPKNRKRDICIIGTQHQCNGIETDVIVHVYVADCKFCQQSEADPVIISRAKAKLILSTYERLECKCGWKKSDQEAETGWHTPDESDEETLSDSQPLIPSASPSAFSWERFIGLERKHQALMVIMILIFFALIAVGILIATWPPKGVY